MMQLNILKCIFVFGLMKEKAFSLMCACVWIWQIYCSAVEPNLLDWFTDLGFRSSFSQIFELIILVLRTQCHSDTFPVWNHEHM